MSTYAYLYTFRGSANMHVVILAAWIIRILRILSYWDIQDLRNHVMSQQLYTSKSNGNGTVFKAIISWVGKSHKLWCSTGLYTCTCCTTWNRVTVVEQKLYPCFRGRRCELLGKVVGLLFRPEFQFLSPIWNTRNAYRLFSRSKIRYTLVF